MRRDARAFNEFYKSLNIKKAGPRLSSSYRGSRRNKYFGRPNRGKKR